MLVPKQAPPVNRLRPMDPYLVVAFPASDPRGPLWVIPTAADPQPDRYSYFRLPGNERSAICPVLSSHAVARCYRSGGWS